MVSRHSHKVLTQGISHKQHFTGRRSNAQQRTTAQIYSTPQAETKLASSTKSSEMLKAVAGSLQRVVSVARGRRVHNIAPVFEGEENNLLRHLRCLR